MAIITPELVRRTSVDSHPFLPEGSILVGPFFGDDLDAALAELLPHVVPWEPEECDDTLSSDRYEVQA